MLHPCHNSSRRVDTISVSTRHLGIVRNAVCPRLHLVDASVVRPSPSDTPISRSLNWKPVYSSPATGTVSYPNSLSSMILLVVWLSARTDASSPCNSANTFMISAIPSTGLASCQSAPRFLFPPPLAAYIGVGDSSVSMHLSIVDAPALTVSSKTTTGLEHTFTPSLYSLSAG